MNRANIINALLSKTQGTSYLEIGTYNGWCFERVTASRKVGIDPNPVFKDSRIHVTTSDEFFAQNTEKFDVILVDGLHEDQQVFRDINNALRFLNPGGYIVLHDLNPQKKEHQVVPYAGGHWNGDCWKAFVRFRAMNNGYQCFTVNVDQGCGVIHPTFNTQLMTQRIAITPELAYEDLEVHRQEWLNLVSWDEFYALLDDSLDAKLRAYFGDPEDPENNWTLGCHYQKIGQTASAVSFFIRAAERTDDKLLQYESMIRAALCFMAQGTRGLSVRGLLHRAMTILPKRPEAYFLLARWWEREAQIESWVNCYSYASIAEQLCDRDCPPLRTWVEYPGWYGILFEKAVSAWWVGQCEESRDIFLHLLKSYKLDGSHYTAVVNNLRFMESTTGRKLLPPGIN